jgi:hypothetical protein
MTSATAKAGSGWIGFAGIMLILAGALDIVDGIWALGAQDTRFDAIFWDNNIEAWGWFYLILGIVLVFAGFAVFQRAQWAVWTGIIVAGIGAVTNMFWVFTFPIASLILVTVNILVIYALAVYGTEETGAYSP